MSLFMYFSICEWSWLPISEQSDTMCIEMCDHADELHREAMAAIAKQGERMVDLHLQAMAAVAALAERTAGLEAAGR